MAAAGEEVTAALGALNDVSDAFTPTVAIFPMSAVSASFIGTAQLQRRFDPSDDWRVVEEYTTSAEKDVVVSKPGTQFRIEISAYTSGALNTVMSQ